MKEEENRKMKLKIKHVETRVVSISSALSGALTNIVRDSTIDPTTPAQCVLKKSGRGSSSPSSSVIASVFCPYELSEVRPYTLCLVVRHRVLILKMHGHTGRCLWLSAVREINKSSRCSLRCALSRRWTRYSRKKEAKTSAGGARNLKCGP